MKSCAAATSFCAFYLIFTSDPSSIFSSNALWNRIFEPSLDDQKKTPSSSGPTPVIPLIPNFSRRVFTPKSISE